MLFLVTLATVHTGRHPAKTKGPFDHLSPCIQPPPFEGLTTDISLMGVLQTLQGQYEAIESTLFGSFSFYRDDITLNVTTYQLPFFTHCLIMSSPDGSALFLLTAIGHSTYKHILFFPSSCEWISGLFPVLRNY